MLVYGVIGTNQQIIVETEKYISSENEVLMQCVRPGVEYFANSNGTWCLFEENIEKLKTNKLAQIRAWTEHAIIAGFSSDCAGVSARFDSDIATQITMQGIALNINSEQFATDYPGGFSIRGYANDSDTKTVFMLAPTQVLQFCADQSKHIRMQKQHGWELQQAVTAAVSAEELAAITWQMQ